MDCSLLSSQIIKSCNLVQNGFRVNITIFRRGVIHSIDDAQ